MLDPETLEVIEPGSGGEGRVARRGHIPIGYYNDPEKTAATFVEHGGERWVLTGDVATVLDDGAIQLLGRGSMCINTGGEKVFPEEVEGVLLGHPAVYDAIVVGVPDPRWGERVTAVVQITAGSRRRRRRVDRALPRATRRLQAAREPSSPSTPCNDHRSARRTTGGPRRSQ